MLAGLSDECTEVRDVGFYLKFALVTPVYNTYFSYVIKFTFIIYRRAGATQPLLLMKVNFIT